MGFWRKHAAKYVNRDPLYLRSIFDAYTQNWPDLHDKYRHWKPAAQLPADKSVIRSAMKQEYALEAEPVTWTIYSAYAMEYCDLGNYVDNESLEHIEKCRKSKYLLLGEERTDDILKWLQIDSSCAVIQTHQQLEDAIRSARDRLTRSKVWDPIGLSDNDIDQIRMSILNSMVEQTALLAEWRAYSVSVGKSEYVDD